MTGESILYRLYDLCHFDPVKDLMVDAMHSIVLNLIRSELEKNLLRPLGENADCDVASRVPQAGGLLDRKDLAAALEKVDWTTEMKDGRVPSVNLGAGTSGLHPLGNWKAEEFTKFVTVAPIVLRNIIPQKAYESFCLLSRIHHLVFCSELRIQGRTSEHVAQHLLWRHHILFEDLYGMGSCTENVESSLHMVEDIYRHSSLDNYWCYLYERLVKYYKNQTTNKKNMCKTFSDRASQLHFIETYLHTHSDPLESTVERFQMVDIEKEPIFLRAKSAKDAADLKEYLASKELPEKVEAAYKSGIIIGTPKLFHLESRQLADIKYWLSTARRNLDCDLPPIAYSCTHVMKSNDDHLATIFRTGEHIIISDSTLPQEWAMKIHQFIIYGPIFGSYHLFVDGLYYAAKASHGNTIMDKWTKQPFMIQRHYSRLRVQPLHLVRRKVIVYKTSPNDHLITDLDQPVVVSDVHVPYYPKDGEVVKVCYHGTTQLLFVSTVSSAKVSGYKLKLVRGRNSRWVKETRLIEVPLLNIILAVKAQQNLGFFELEI